MKTMTTLARLSFWIPAEQMAPFAMAYERQLVPYLKAHGLVAATETGRPTAEGVFSRLFGVDSPGAIVEQRQRLQGDLAWQQILRRLAVDLSDGPPRDALPYHLGIYRTPVGPGKTTEAGAGIRQGLWHSLGLKDGAPMGIRSILQDRQSTMWIAMSTGNGICRYDGAQFTTFSCADGLANDKVRGILEDRRGHLWLATESGLSRYDGQSFETFTRADGLGHDLVLSLLEDGAGQLWCGTGGGGVSRFDGQSWSTFTTADGLVSNWVGALLEDGQGHMWFGTGQGHELYRLEHKGGGLSRFDGQNWATFTTADGLGSATILALSEDGQGRLWAGTSEGGTSYFDGVGFVAAEELASESIMSIVADPQGQVWFATGLNGVYRFDGAQWRSFTFADGLISDQVFCVAADRQGNLWFGSVSGLSRYDQGAFAHFTRADGLAHDGVVSILQDRQQRLWFGTFKGVSQYEGTALTDSERLAEWNVWSIMEDRQGHLWFGDSWDKGLMRYDGRNFTHFTSADGLADNSVWAICEDRQGHLWLGSRTGGGVSRYDGEGWTIFTTADGLAANSVRAILEDRHGHLWFATYTGGVSYYVPDSTAGQQFRSLTTADGLADNNVWSILEDRQGHLWFGTGGGVSRYDGRTFESFTSEEGLAYSYVTSLMEDRRGHLWMGTFGGGVSRYDGCVFQSLSRQDGLVFDTIQAIVEDHQGAVWIGTEGGVTRYGSASVPPQIRLRWIVADRHYDPSEPIRIPSSQKLVIVEFQGYSSTTRPEQFAYVYQLEGYDAGWQPVYSRQVTYRDLPEGDYTFWVKAVDRDLNYSEPAQVQLTIEPDALVESLTAALGQSSPQGEFVGNSAALKKVQQQLRQVAPTDLSVLVMGETGTGKGLVARALHELSPRRAKGFVSVNCGAIPEALIESELFGHERGAFTGATSRRLGKVELAVDGTLFLDEIGDMPLTAQVKLLHLLQERTFERVGGTQVLSAEVRVVAATNRDLYQMVAAGTFRQDLYFRLQGFEVQLPPLRDRREDIPLLALYFIAPMAAHLDKDVKGLSPVAEAALVAHEWPGNVRELQHTIERAVVACEGPVIGVEDLMLSQPPGRSLPANTLGTLEENERRHIQAALESTGGRISGPKGAATILGVPDSTLRARMRKLGIKRR